MRQNLPVGLASLNSAVVYEQYTKLTVDLSHQKSVPRTASAAAGVEL